MGWEPSYCLVAIVLMNGQSPSRLSSLPSVPCKSLQGEDCVPCTGQGSTLIKKNSVSFLIKISLLPTISVTDGRERTDNQIEKALKAVVN